MTGLQGLTEFRVAFGYRREGTGWEIRGRDSADPVARLWKPGPPRGSVPFEVYGGAATAELIGLVTSRDAATPDRQVVGRVRRYSGSNPFADCWTFEQFGLGELEGKAAGFGSVVRNSVSWYNSDTSIGDLVAPLSLRFSGAGSAGFRITRPAGPLTRFQVAVEDPAVDRLLVLSVVRLFELTTGDWDARRLVPRLGGLLRRRDGD
ncbi:hypothetical protein OG455_18965 [Kitasatospora sp. NBC_01287]|uniref:hypothetical protein n=1 Tax=Kitasatospora sp. NBC_01287 TaxID=2903573 RepID=UPI002250BFE3|nr:hypothetical protein [Kitasatospora sp. NBC_01287]MCX4747573.1 hypothetical protein [Kitasatospora sp. NBC_01287]